MKTLTVLGAGFGGLATAYELSKLLPKNNRVLLVDRKRKFSMGLSHLWLMTGERKTREECERDLAAVEKHGVVFVNEEVLKIDPAKKTVKTTGGEWQSDYLVIALGAALAPAEIPGFQESALNLYEIEGALQIQKQLQAFRGGRVAVLITRTPFKCPPAPYEAALLLDSYLRGRGLREKTEIDVYTPEPQPMPVAGREVGAAVEKMLAERGIGYHKQHTVVKVEDHKLVFDKAEAAYDLLIGVPPHRPPQVVVDAGLTDSTGWIPVDSRSMRTGFENVFAVGDVVSIRLENGMYLPKAGVFAEAQGAAVARIIAAEVLDMDARELFDGKGYCFLDVGDGMAALGTGDFYASPAPRITLEPPSQRHRIEKLNFEKTRLQAWLP
ncbi:MAG: FAD/NAD(P)-binding oxidoreductase [Candidatus Caldarchaeum sp.]|nr:FAD/NAD(P)-binding oxidoreductase [Candidatus Caldarchaeum sp.]